MYVYCPPSPNPLPKERAFTLAASLEKSSGGTGRMTIREISSGQGELLSPGERTQVRAGQKLKLVLTLSLIPAFSPRRRRTAHSVFGNIHDWIYHATNRVSRKRES
jgi:hypothetical protein